MPAATAKPEYSCGRFYNRSPLPTDAISRAVTLRLLKLHEASGLSEYEAAKRAGLSHNTLFRLRTRLGIPSIDTMIRLAAVYGVDPAALLVPDEARDVSNGPSSETDPAIDNSRSSPTFIPEVSQSTETVERPKLNSESNQQHNAHLADQTMPPMT